MIWQKEISLPAPGRGYYLITSLILKELPELPQSGLLNLFIRHTSAGITINENADPSVRTDFETVMNKLAPDLDPDYTHTTEGSDDMPAHIKASLLGNSITIPVTGGKLNLGVWQGIYLCEFRNRGGSRKLVITLYS